MLVLHIVYDTNIYTTIRQTQDYLFSRKEVKKLTTHVFTFAKKDIRTCKNYNVLLGLFLPSKDFKIKTSG